MYIQKLIISLSLCLIGMAVTSCGNNSHYIAAQLEGSDLWSIVDLNTGEVIHKDEFKNKPSAIVNGKFCVRNDIGTFEYFTVDNVVKPINKERYLYATSFTDNDVAIVVPVGKGIKLIDGNCNVIASLNDTITEAKEFSHGYAAVKGKGHFNTWGYINENGEVVINLSYDYAHDFSKDGIAIVEDGTEYYELGYYRYKTTEYHAIDTKGNELFSLDADEYQDIGEFSDGYLPAKKQNGELVLLDKTGKEVCSVEHFDKYIYYLETRKCTNGEYHVYKEKDSYGLKKMTGEIAIRTKYDKIMPLPTSGHDYYLAVKQDKSGIINSQDETIVPFENALFPLIDKSGNIPVVLAEDSGSTTFSLKNLKLENIGHNKFRDFSKWKMAGTTNIESNYFDVDKAATRLTSEYYTITDSTFFGTNKDMTLVELDNTYLLDDDIYFVDSDSHNSTIETWKRGRADNTIYYFDRNVYDDSAKLIAVKELSYVYLHNYQPGTEEALAEAFDSLIQNKGFSPVEGQPHWFLSDKGGMAVALSYKDGEVNLNCTYSNYYDIERISRTEQIVVPPEISYHDVNYERFEL